MAIQKCESCYKITGVDVSYTATGSALTLTVTDPCCRYTDCKSIRGVLVEALRTAADNTLISDNELTCCGCGDGPAAVPADAQWDFGNKSLILAGDYSAVSPASGTFEVTTPYAPGA